MDPKDFDRIREYNLGLTDIGKTSSGPDADIRLDHIDVEGFRRKIELFAPGWVAFNGKKAAQNVLRDRSLRYGPQTQRIGQSSVYVLPSTSNAANGAWDVEWWTRFAYLIHEP